MSASLIAAQGLTRSYRSGAHVTKVLDGVSLDVYGGQLVLLTGPSGSGKTTLLSVLAGLLRSDEGAVSLAGQPLSRLSERRVARLRREEVGFVFQAFHLFEAMSARDNVAEVLAMRGVSIRQARELATGLLEEVGLAAQVAQPAKRLSAGQKQRVAIARAFAGEPRVIFCDEPTAALDTENATEVMRLLRARITEERCALVVTHDRRLARYADRVLALEDGRLREEAA